MGHDTSTDVGWSRALDELVSASVSNQREIDALQAAQSQLLVDAVELVVAREAQRRGVSGRPGAGDLAAREVAAEFGAALRVSDRTVQTRMGDAVLLDTRFVATRAAWQRGSVSAAHVAAILDAGVAITDDATRARFEARAIEIAQVESPARTRAAVRVLAATLDPSAAESARARARTERGVRVIDLGDGAARLQIEHDAVLIHAIEDRLARITRQVMDAEPAIPAAEQGPSEVGTQVLTGPADRGSTGQRAEEADATPDRRTFRQMRADIAVDLLLTGGPSAHAHAPDVRGHVQVTVPALTLLGAGHEPVLLSGYGPIDIDTAKRIMRGAPGWDRVLTDPVDGRVLAVDRYRATQRLRRFLGARDERCRFPGCRRPVERCDVDHTVDAALGGVTAESNLAHLCRRHHTLKHHTGWTVRQRGGGVLEWRGPTGRRYEDRPPSSVRFVPDSALAPVGAAPPGRVHGATGGLPAKAGGSRGEAVRQRDAVDAGRDTVLTGASPPF